MWLSAIGTHGRAFSTPFLQIYLLQGTILKYYFFLFNFENSDLSVWCFTCDAYLDAQVIMQLRPVYETAYILKFGEAPPFRTVELPQDSTSTKN